MQKPNLARDESYLFARKIVQLYKLHAVNHAYRPLVLQLMRAGTSIGANVEEAIGAESRADFVHKMNIAYKEARESQYWLRLFQDESILNGQSAQEAATQAEVLVRILYKICQTTRKND